MLKIYYEVIDGRTKATLVAHMRDGDTALSQAFGKDEREALETLMICEKISFANAQRRMNAVQEALDKSPSRSGYGLQNLPMVARAFRECRLVRPALPTGTARPS